MYCCEKCFKDNEITSIIESNGLKGDCDFCGAKNVNIISVNNENIVSNLEKVIDCYTEEKYLVNDYPKNNIKSFVRAIQEDWDIFNLSENKLIKLLESIFGYQDRFHANVGNPELLNPQYLETYSIFGDNSWEGFKTEIITKNRFHSNIINEKALSEILKYSIREYSIYNVFYRGRISNSNKCIQPNEMMSPPNDRAKSGRANPEGISFLYLANNYQTIFHEIRAGINDYVTIGEFKLLDNVSIADISGIDKISPFVDIDINLIMANIEHLKNISNNIAKPLRRNDSLLEYIPTQYICEFIKYQGFDGIQFNSSVHEGGICYVLFNEQKTKCVSTELFEVKSLNYDYVKVS